MIMENKNVLINKLKTIKAHRLVLLSVIFSTIFAEIIVGSFSIFFRGKVTYEYMITGTVAAFLVSLTNMYLLIQLITQLREEEERFRSAFETAAIGMAIESLDGRWLKINSSLCRMVGYSDQELSAMTFSDITHPDDLEIDIAYKKHLLTGEISYYHREKRCLHKSGHIVWMHLSLSLVRDVHHNPSYFLVIIEDITERKKAEQQIKQSLKEKEVLLREIHHRVKNNMAVVSSLLSLEARKIKDVTVRALFEETRQRVKSMALVHEKLYQTKDLSSVNFEDYIRSIVSEIISLYRIDTSAITVEINIEDMELDLESAVPCGLIINELLTNAFKYAFPKNGRGGLSINFTKTDDNYTLAIKDNGVGLPEGFDYNEASTLGLQLVNILTGQLGGTLQIKSDKGTEAVITFKTEKA
jgi:PAS domain S-box-containing protein